MQKITQPASQPAMPKKCPVCFQIVADIIQPVIFGNDQCILYSEDFRKVLSSIPTGSVSAVITDPPYGSGGNTVKEIKRSSKDKYVSTNAAYAKLLPDIDGDSIHPTAWKSLMQDLCLATLHVLQKDGGIFVFFY